MSLTDIHTAERQGEALLQSLGPAAGVERALHLPSVDSTNLLAKRLARSGLAAETLILADGQTSGRGRLGRSFMSPPGEGLWFTRMMRPPEGGPVHPAMTLVAGLAVCTALRRMGVAGAAVKWPNDILIDGLKVAGILAEAGSDEAGRPFLVLGIGVNLDNIAFPPELAGIATSVYLATGFRLNRIELLRTILAELERLRRQLSTDGFQAVRPAYLASSAVMGRDVLLIDPATGNAETALCVDVDDDGALVLDSPDGRRFRRHAGEISLRLPGAEGRRP